MAVMHDAALFSSPGATTKAPGGCKDQEVKGRAMMSKVRGAIIAGIWRAIRTTKEMLGRRKVLGEMMSNTAEVRLSGGPGQWKPSIGPVSTAPKDDSKNST